MAAPPERADAGPGRERGWLERLWSSIAERGRRSPSAPTETSLDRALVLADALLSERGEASGAAVAQELQSVLRAAGAEQRLAFYGAVAAKFDPDPARLRAAAEAYLADSTPERAGKLADAAEPVRQELLRRMNMAPGGTAALVAMREEVLAQLRAEPALKPLDADLRHLFGSWFNRGFLQLRRIDWQTPAAVLEKLIAYEAVHEIAGWPDLRRRLAPDRRCFGFFHPALPGEPLIFVEVALVRGLAAAIAPLLQPMPDDQAADQARQADTAIFYSISNCQDGLRGVSFGNFLIKQVAAELRAELPQIQRFSTLSPIPGFRRWLDRALAGPTPLPFAIADAAPEDATAASADAADDPALAAVLAEQLRRDTWWTEPRHAQALRGPLLRACAAYLTQSPVDGARIDPVARFHLGNGARLERVNWLGNTGPRGIAESYGLMVNYLYDLSAIEANHEAFVRDAAVVRSAEVDALLAAPPARRRRNRATAAA